MKLKTTLKLLLLSIIFSIISVNAYASYNFSSSFSVESQPKSITLALSQEFEINIVIRVPKGNYLYADKLDVDFNSLEGILIKDIVIPEPILKEDKFFNEVVGVYDNDVEITIIGQTPDTTKLGNLTLNVSLKYQGCSEKLCYRPEDRELLFNIQINKQLSSPKATLPDAPVKQKTGFLNLLKIPDFSKIMDKGLFIALIIIFLAGFLVTLTPCVWPVVPVVLSIIGVGARTKWWKNIVLSSSLVAGLVLINSALGITASYFGKNIGFLFQKKIFLVFVIFFFLFMSFSMLGLFEFNLLKRFEKHLTKLGGKGYLGAFLIGISIGFLASPCASPVLVGLLGYVSLQQSYFVGILLFLSFSLGMGLFFLIIGSLFGIISGALKSGRWMIYAKRILGIMLLIPAIFYFMSLVGYSSISKITKDKTIPQIEWINSIDNAFQFAKKTDRPVMIDFYANWCPPCHALDAKFFTRNDIVKLSYQLVPVKINATAEANNIKKILSEFQVKGMPTILFVSPDRKVFWDLTVVSYNPKLIQKNMLEAIKRAKE